MSRARVFVARLRGLLGRKRLDDELNEEFRFHLDMQMEDNLKAGMGPAEARQAAMRSFGGVVRTQEMYRERRAFAFAETMAQDLRYALRTLRKNPGFTVASVTVLALAIGANTAMFSVLNTVLLQPLPYRSPERLAMLWTEDPARNLREDRSALWDVEQWRKQSESFAEIGTFDTVSTILTGTNGTEQIPCASISPNLLSLLGIQPIAGRSFSAEEAEQGQRLVLISHRFWQTRFGGSHEALGAPLVLDGVLSRIIGILPANFDVARTDADVWKGHTDHQSMRGSETWFAVGRLRPGVTFEQAQAEMRTVAHRLNEGLPVAERGRDISVVPLDQYVLGPQIRLGLWILWGAVFCVLLIAAANVTSLTLARGVAREREIAIRASLGASALRIVRQLLTEALLLAIVSGMAGTLLGFAGIHLIRVFGPDSLPRLSEISLGLPALIWALAISVFAGCLVGFSSAVATLRGGLRPAAGEGGRPTTGSAVASRIRRALVVADFALAIILLAGAGLLIRSWWTVTGIDPGFRSEQVLVMRLASPPDFNIPTQRASLYHRVLDAVQALPGVTNAGIIDDLFIENSKERMITVERDDGAFSERQRFRIDEVSTDFFRTMGTRLLRGRFLSASDGPDALRVAMINDAMARHFWPESDPVGRRFRLGPNAGGGPWYTVVGVAEDMRRQGPEREPFPQAFVPLAQNGASRSVNLFVRSSLHSPVAMASALRTAVHGVEKNAPLYEVTPLEQQFESYLAQRRFQTSLLTGLSIVALLMAAVGIYGLIQYSISARTRDIGIRMAIGAEAGEIFRMVLAEGLKLSFAGLAAGTAGALWLGRAGSSLLYGVGPADPFTFLAVSLLLIAVAVAACYFPARRAMKIEPIMALRQE